MGYIVMRERRRFGAAPPASPQPDDEPDAEPVPHA